jgi:hypothetical protein
MIDCMSLHQQISALMESSNHRMSKVCQHCL